MNSTIFNKYVQVANFFARCQYDNRIQKLRTLLLTFFADKYHMKLYTKPVVWVTYIAVYNGPLSSTLLDVLTKYELTQDNIDYLNEYLVLDDNNMYGFYQSINNVDLNEFDKTDIESLEFTKSFYNNIDTDELIKITKSYPEYIKNYQEIFGNIINWEDFFDDYKELQYPDYYKNINPNSLFFDISKLKKDVKMQKFI